MTDGRPSVLALPDYRESNPYQAALAEALERRGVDVRTVDGRGDALPISQAVFAAGRPPILHLHFLAPFMIVEHDRYERLGVAGALSVLLGIRLAVDLLVASLLVDRVVWTAHDLRNHRGRAVRTELALKHLLVRLVCDAVVVHCDRATELLLETFRLPESARARMRTVPHGHFLDRYPDETNRATAREVLDLPADATVVLFFGWIRRYKNVTGLVSAFRALDRPDARLVVAGNPRTESLATAVRNAAGDDDRIRTALEFVPHVDVQTYMRAADVVALPFRTSGQSLLTSGSVLLAMGFERAVLAPRLGCVPPLLAGPEDPSTDGGTPSKRSTGGCERDERDEPGEAGGRTTTESTGAGVTATAGGVLYDADRQLATALEAALDADLARMGQRNRRHVERLDWDDIAARTAAIYRESPTERVC